MAVARAGIEMTKSGRREYATMLGQIRNVCEVDLSSLRLDGHTLAALIAVETGDPAWTLRDLAIREGATGLLLLQYEGECCPIGSLRTALTAPCPLLQNAV